MKCYFRKNHPFKGLVPVYLTDETNPTDKQKIAFISE